MAMMLEPAGWDGGFMWSRVRGGNLSASQLIIRSRRGSNRSAQSRSSSGHRLPEKEEECRENAPSGLTCGEGVSSMLRVGLAPSFRGLGHGPFTAATRVRLPSGSLFWAWFNLR